MSQRFFWIGSSLEASLSLMAIVLNVVAGQPFFNDLHWDWTGAVMGLAATIPPLAFFIWVVRGSAGPLQRLRHFLLHQVRPLFAHWSIGQLLLISLLAGLGEELLFRGVIQGSLTRWLGLLPALALGSVIFGLCHFLTLSYLVVTTLMGIYLGALWVMTGNLLAPVLTHALYDFLALVYFLRRVS